MSKQFAVQERATWVGTDAVRPRGSTGTVREIDGDRIYVDWGYDRDVPRDEQPDAEGWCDRADLLPGFVPEDKLP